MAVHHQPRALTAQAALTVLVSRHADGDLHDGVRDRLERAESVVALQDVEVVGLRPGLNDLTVEVRATVDVSARPDADARAVEASLERTFGVEDATVTLE